MTRTALARRSPLRRRVALRSGGLKTGRSPRKRTQGQLRIRYTALDRLFSVWIRRRDRVCQRCGRAGGRLEAAHMFGRGKHSVRYAPENCYALCGGPNPAACHRLFDTHETEKHEWLRMRLGEERYVALAVRARTPLVGVMRRIQLSAVQAWLTEELARDV